MAVIIDKKSQETEETEEPKSSENSLELKLGPNKSVGISPWKAKAKKEFVKIFKAKGDKVTEKDVLDILVYPYIDDIKQFYSSAELQYIMTKIREISIKDRDVNFTIECSTCKEDIDVDMDIYDLVHYKETLIPTIKENIEWVDPESSDIIEKTLLDNEEEPPDVIMLGLNIKSINGQEIKNIEEFLEIYDELDMNEISKIENTWKEITPSFSIYSTLKCDKCENSNEYYFDIIPGFFDPLLPKN